MKYILSLMCLLAISCSDKKEVTLNTVKVEQGDIYESVTATGTVECVTKVNVGTQVTGIISKLYVDFNSKVKKGELIAELEKTLMESELKSANSNLESSKQTYEFNRKNYYRDKELHDKQLISDLNFETSRKDYLVSKATYEKAQADRVKAAKNLNYTEIYSPIDGIVISREVEEGQTVVSSMNVANLYTIADLTNMQVIANVDEADIGQVKLGQSATFTVDAFPNDTFNGKITQVRLSPTITSNVVTYEVVINAPNPNLKLIPGLTANITINVKERKNVLILPIKVLKFTPQEWENVKGLPSFDSNIVIKKNIGNSKDTSKSILWIVRNNMLIPAEITVGDDNGINFHVVSGLNKGDVVALEYQIGSENNEANKNNSDSPFMPKPPGGNKKK